MPEFFLELDRHLFYFINHDLSNSFFDWLMPLLRMPKFWIPLYVFIIVFCIWKYKKRGIVIIILLAAAAGFADFTSATGIKALYKRARPCRAEGIASIDILRVPCGPGYSFPSTHATDHFAMAIFLCMVFGRKWPWIWLWAILWAGSICFAQVYVGVHFPIDVTVGALYGALVGVGFGYLFKYICTRFSI